MKILVLSHGQLAKALIETLSLFIENDNFYYICFEGDLDMFREQLIAYKDDDVVVCCDILGGTPYNEAMKVFESNVEIFSGINLPLLLELKFCKNLEEVKSISLDDKISKRKQEDKVVSDIEIEL